VDLTNTYRITRRRLLGSTAAGAAGIALWSACGGEGDRGSEDEQPKRGGTLRMGSSLPFSSGLDPHLEQGAGLGVIPRLYGYLLHVDPRDDAVIYDQAEGVEQPDDNTYLIAMRDGVRFHDVSPAEGAPVTAHDAAASIARFRDNPVAVGKLWHSTLLDRAEATDDRTLRVTTKRPYVYSLAELGNLNAGVILPRSLIDADISLFDRAAGSGPFSLSEANPDDRAILSRFDRYYRSPLPYLDRMEWRIFGSTEDTLTALVRDEVDVAGARSRAEANALADQYDDLEASATPSLAWLSIGFRIDRQPVADERVRGAIDLALDRDGLVRDLLAGDGHPVGPVNSVLGDGFWSPSDQDLRSTRGGESSMDERIAAAIALLVAAGAENASFALQVADQPPLIAAAEAVKAQIEQTGLSVRIERLDLLQWYNNLQTGAFDATVISHLPYETPDLPLRFYHSAGPDGVANPFAFADGSVDAAIERAWGERDRDLRRNAILEAQRIGMRGRPVLQLFTGMTFSAARSRVRNRKPELFGSLAQYNYEQWLQD
jgi:peptide/nickel transport system substrate-binding protein